MNDILELKLAQLNFCVGDLEGNSNKIIKTTREFCLKKKNRIAVFPELAITGYPPEDLLLRPAFLKKVESEIDRIMKECKGCSLVFGYPERTDDKLFNSCILISDGKIVGNYRKQNLPNYAVFDEKRYFLEGDSPCFWNFRGFKIGFSICEDIWVPETAKRLGNESVDFVINVNASPFHSGKGKEREKIIKKASAVAKAPIFYNNLIGGQDELVFDGASFVVNKRGEVLAKAESFKEDSITLTIKKGGDITITKSSAREMTKIEEIYRAVKTGIKDYVNKNHFSGCVIGLSGGIDSALTLALAVDALGPKKVTAISMPSSYTSSISILDAEKEAINLGCNFKIIEIKNIVTSFTASLESSIPNFKTGVVEQNIQARSRGMILMAFSNANNYMVLATGNKSEMAVGYATLYGDMAGGFAPLKDIPKGLVYELANYRNTVSHVIPERVINREPTAELAPNQKDSDSLPVYPVLDAILESYIEKDCSPLEISKEGSDLKTCEKVASMVDRNEYKRRQAAPGVKITTRAFGRDRRFPITSRYSESRQEK